MPSEPRGTLDGMATLVKDPAPAEFEALLERRHRLGQDVLDEVRNGVYHMNPAPHSRHSQVQQQLAELLGPLARKAGLAPRLGIFNLGEPGDYRVPAGALLRPGADAVYLPTAALVVEIVSPGDDTWEKLEFYAAHEVAELLIVDPEKRQVDWLGLAPGGDYAPVEGSGLIDLAPAQLAERLDWPE